MNMYITYIDMKKRSTSDDHRQITQQAQPYSNQLLWGLNQFNTLCHFHDKKTEAEQKPECGVQGVTHRASLSHTKVVLTADGSCVKVLFIVDHESQL